MYKIPKGTDCVTRIPSGRYLEMVILSAVSHEAEAESSRYIPASPAAAVGVSPDAEGVALSVGPAASPARSLFPDDIIFLMVDFGS